MDPLDSDTITAADLLKHGKPFVPFSEFSVQDIHHLLKDPSYEWIDTKLREGKPFVIRGFNNMEQWDQDVLSHKRLASSSACTRKSFSGFHRCFSATVALNLMIESEGTGPGALCFGTDTDSQALYDVFKDSLGKVPHTDWSNVPLSQLQTAEFPIYVTHQGPGDLVVFPSATAHQVWNVSPIVTKVVWNIMHTSSLALFFDYVQPAYQKQCYADTGRVPLIPMHALSSGHAANADAKLVLDIFQRLVDDEDVGDNSIPIKLADTEGAVVECNFCGLTIWNRHMHCNHNEKPVRPRVRSVDSRGRIAGFVDNVFDQKRGKKASLAGASSSPQTPVSLPRGQKRSRMSNDDGQLFGASSRARGPSATGPSRTPRSLGTETQQMRISGLVDSRRTPVETGPFSGVRSQMTSPRVTENATFSGQNEPHETVSPGSKSVDDDSIRVLENKLEALRQYATELLDLSLVESHGKIVERIAQLEEEMERRRREKAKKLLGRLQQDFPDLADVAREEARRRGW
ncbi:hypothetical protein BDV59DRAFT_198568 [Aspergillus ambiguus]|uniref:uncharacterized protein n=1 Tax=Aspergillus ambiguus TaxID=176160 RepID=UPI003CCDDB06